MAHTFSHAVHSLPVVVVFLLLSCLSWKISAQPYSPCETSSSCCFEISFNSTPGIEGVPLAQAYQIPQVLEGSPWGAGSLGIKIAPDPSMVVPGQRYLYPIVLLNSSAVTVIHDWKDLRTPGAGLVAIMATGVSTNTFQPLKGNSIMVVNFTRPACLQSVTLLRTWSLAQRMGIDIEVFDIAWNRISKNSYPWSLQVTQGWVNASYSASNVGAVRMSFNGAGYGALVGIEACYPDTAFDRCGICGGNGSRCAPPPAGPQPGDACFNASMSNPVCRAGRYDSTMACVPTLLGVTPDTCNGIDDDCDGVIDGGAPELNATCGVGACYNIVYYCGELNRSISLSSNCTPGTPTVEVCNGIDDDCDGVIDNGNVCAQPLTGVAVVPTSRCVSGLFGDGTSCAAHFGYWNSDPLFRVNRPFGVGSQFNSITVSPIQLTNQELSLLAVPSTFAANASDQDAFSVPLNCNNGSVVWTLGDGLNHYLSAIVYAASSPPCESVLGGWSNTLKRPISVYVDSPCVYRDENNTMCSTSFGYYNPNLDSPAYFIPASDANNSFILGTTPVSSFSPPSLFFQQRVRQAALVEWSCPLGTEYMTWKLVTAGVTHLAIALPSTNGCQ